MTDATVSVRVDKQTHEQMILHDAVNWSAVVRKSINSTLEGIEQIDIEKAKKAAKIIDTLRATKSFSKGKKSTDIIREWRDKRQ